MSRLQQSGTLDGVGANKSQYFYYNAEQRLCRHYVPEHGATLYNYDWAGQMIAYAKGQPNTGCTVPSNNNRVDLTYDGVGRVTHTDFADPATPDITVTYDANGNVLSNTRGSGASAISWAYDYNELDVLTNEQLSVDGLAYDLAYKYNSAGHMTQKTLPSGRVVDYTPDGLGRYNNISENGNNLASNMDYHASGALLNMNYGNGVEFSQTLNARLLPHRLTTRKVTGTSTRTDWVSSSGSAAPAAPPTPAPEPIVIDVWKSKHSWLADAWCETNAPKYLTASWLGFYCELTQVTQPAPEPEPAPAPASAPTQTAVTVTQLDFATGPVSELDLTYSYDAMGRIIQQTNGVNSHHSRDYSYDILGQLKTANSPAWGNASYRYDPIGNLLSKTIGGRTVTNSYNNLNRITKSVDTVNGTRTITHDARGNVTRLGALYMSYDMSDQPVSVSGTGRTGEAANGTYRYDGKLKRVKSVVSGKTIYNVYDASGSLVHVDKYSNDNPAADITDYIRGPKGTLARITNDGTRDNITYLHKDHLGSAQTGTNAAGEVMWSEHYTPYGETLINNAANDNLDGFTGHIKDRATGLNYMQARYYDPAIGRFLSVDPVTFLNAYDPRYFNRYTYTFNNPVNNIDPDGLQVIEDGALNITVSAGASITAGHSDFPERGSLGASGDIVTTIGIGIPSASRGESVPFTAGIVTIDAVGALETVMNQGSFNGIAADIDIEGGISLGTIKDRLGASTTFEGDLGVAGIEMTFTNKIAGTTLKLGPGPGVAAGSHQGVTHLTGMTSFKSGGGDFFETDVEDCSFGCDRNVDNEDEDDAGG